MIPYLPPSLTRFDPKKIVFSTWVDHLAFGYDAVIATKPRLLVELGSHNGFSYFTFCQAVVENELNTVCYAIDSWEGEEHAGIFDDSVFKEFMSHNREYYRGFSYPQKMLFEQAVGNFADDSIDLLHIDGLHTYDAVKQDFDSWYPKVSAGGLILMHDIHARIKDFGVWKLWSELKQEHDTFEFDHGFGLGILRKPGGSTNTSELHQMMFSDDDLVTAALKKYYVMASRHLELKRKLARLQSVPAGN